MPDNSLQNAVAVAMDSNDQVDVIDGIKSAVIREIERLDPTVSIAKTDYFNHSYAPDLVLSWGNQQEREIYLRYSLRSTRAARDLDLLGGASPVFFSLDSRHDDDQVARSMEGEIGRSLGTLVTNAPTIDGFAADEDSPAEIGSVAEPLLSLFRRNVVRGGRGVLMRETAARLQNTPVGGDIDEDVAYLNAFGQAIPRIFQPDAATRLRRAVSIVGFARTGEAAFFGRTVDDGRASDELVRGRLETDELRVLLPYLLSRANTIDDVAFWEYLGGMISVKQIEQLSDTIGAADLDHLVKANLSTWRAHHALMTFNPEYLDLPEEHRDAPYWSVHAKMLAATAGAWRVHFTADKRRGGSREDSLLARWEDVRRTLAGFTVSSVDLHGITRRVRVSAENVANVFADVDAIHETIVDEFRVRSLSVLPWDDDDSDIEVDFKTMTVEGTNVLIGDLVDAAFDILAYRYPLTEPQREWLLGSRTVRGSLGETTGDETQG